MPTLVCVPITVEDVDAALAKAANAKARGADIIEWRIDSYFPGSEGDTEDAYRVAQLQRLLAESPLPTILTCRSASEGGDYDGDDADRVSLLEKLTAACDTPPDYLDFELAAYTRSANIRQKINLCVQHPKQARNIKTRLILSLHDFDGIPSDLSRRLLAAYEEPACAIVKTAVFARSLRDNLSLFEVLRDAPKPSIALGMGEFGLMSRVLTPKFGGFLTFASLDHEAATAPGQPSLDDLLGMHRFRSIGANTKVYGVIGWPVGHSMSPLIHNAGFGSVGHDGVYLPLPVAANDDAEASYTSLNATLGALLDDAHLDIAGLSVTLPHKENTARFAAQSDWHNDAAIGAVNTVAVGSSGVHVTNTDASAIIALLERHRSAGASLAAQPNAMRVGVVGAGGVARAAAFAIVDAGDTAVLYNRTQSRAEQLAADVNDAANASSDRGRSTPLGKAVPATVESLPKACCHAFLNCTPVGMAGGPDPEGVAVPVRSMANLGPNTLFFDTVYNPVETPLIREARAHGYPTIDGVEMFVRQAAEQFTLWTGNPAPIDLFDTLCRERLTRASRTDEESA